MDIERKYRFSGKRIAIRAEKLSESEYVVSASDAFGNNLSVSFFHTEAEAVEQFEQLLKAYPEDPAYAHFVQYTARKVPAGCGWYFTKYEPATGEGRGWFGTAESKSYAFERKLFNGLLMERECGYGPGCFFNEWGAL